ncbi:MAG: hypothetical protein AABZ31_08350 [Bdellovibrionota bacterium]
MNKLTKILVLLVCGAIVTTTLSSCEEEEDNKVAKAQKCLNDLTDASSDAEAQACMDKISGIESTGAYTIRCSATFFMGGLTTSKIVDAFKLHSDAAANEKEAVLIENLSLSSTAEANAAYDFCEKTGIPGLLKIAALVQIGTMVSSQAGGDISAQIDACIANPGTNPGECDLTSIASSALVLADSYCKG